MHQGDTDFVSRNSYPPGTEPFMDAAFNAEIDVLHPSVIAVEVQGEKYFMMFVKKEARDAFQRPFDEEDVRKDVIRRSEREKREALMKDWITRLRERAEVKTFIDRIPEDKTPEEEETETPSEQTAPEE